VACAFGRIELLPLKHSGPACTYYLTKYLDKAFGTEKTDGEEKCRLFGIWGGVRFVHPEFRLLPHPAAEKGMARRAVEHQRQ